MIRSYSEDRSFFSSGHTAIGVVATKEALTKTQATKSVSMISIGNLRLLQHTSAEE